jgi:sec-independent protein translocase protein TatA
MGPIGIPELAIVLVVLLVIFGPKRLPQLGRQLGSGMREFKDSITAKAGDDDEDERPAPAPRSLEASSQADVAGEARADAHPVEEPPATRPRG